MEKIKLGRKTESTNNVIVRFWSHNHYGKKLKKTDNVYDGTIQDGNDNYHFHSVGEMLKTMEKLVHKKEKERVQGYKKVQ